MKAVLEIEIEFDEDQTDAESVAGAADILLQTALSTEGVLDDFGPVRFGEFFVAKATDEKKILAGPKEDQALAACEKLVTAKDDAEMDEAIALATKAIRSAAP